jgi:hypothetical protein
MKTLYESILDDEDVLVDKIIKTHSNWLLVLKELMIADAPEKDILEFLNNSKPIENIIKGLFNNTKNVYWEVSKKDGMNICRLYDGSIRSINKSSCPIRIKQINSRIIVISFSPYNDLLKSVANNINKNVFDNLKNLFMHFGAKYVSNSKLMLYI